MPHTRRTPPDRAEVSLPDRRRGKPPPRHRGGGPMSASGPRYDGPDEQESLEELFGTVFDLAGEIGSRISQDQVEATLRRTPRAPGRHQEEAPAWTDPARLDTVGAHRSPTPRTPREHEIVRLIARGLSNREIADELVISPATAARHVANILAKLGFNSRTQIASWATGHGTPR